MAEGLILPSPVWRHGHVVDDTTAGRVREFAVRGKHKHAVLVSGTEVLFLPSAVPDLDTLTVYKGWFPNLSRAIHVVSAIANTTAKLPGGRQLIEAVNTRAASGGGGPDGVERAKTLSHVVAVARDDTGEVVGEVHLEGPSPYSLTCELIAWAAQRLASERREPSDPWRHSGSTSLSPAAPRPASRGCDAASQPSRTETTFSAVALADPGFWPVTRRPSTTTYERNGIIPFS